MELPGAAARSATSTPRRHNSFATRQPPLGRGRARALLPSPPSPARAWRGGGAKLAAERGGSRRRRVRAASSPGAEALFGRGPLPAGRRAGPGCGSVAAARRWESPALPLRLFLLCSQRRVRLGRWRDSRFFPLGEGGTVVFLLLSIAQSSNRLRWHVAFLMQWYFFKRCPWFFLFVFCCCCFFR